MIAEITPQEAARELQARRFARQGVLQFAEVIDVPGRAIEDDDERKPFHLIETKLAEHHKIVLTAMDRCSKRDTGRMMIFAPPGSAKSTYASVVFPSDYLGRFASKQIILASYGDTLAVKMGRRTRSIIKQSRYRGIHETALTNESKAANSFSLTNGSEYMACGILSGITGNRADGIVIDDPIKGREQADSQVIRDKTYEAYKDDLLTRLKPGGWLVLIQTRWHEDDLAGRILPDDWNGESGMVMCKDGNEWEILCLQAQCETDSDPLGREPGQYLWPEWFTQNHWAQFKSDTRTWGSLYQQLPKPRQGNLFLPDMIQTLDAMPAGRITWVRGWDLAATEGGGDYSACPRMGLHEDGRIIIDDARRVQYEPNRRDTWIKSIVTGDGRTVTQDFPQDPAAAGKVQVSALTKMLQGFRVFFSPESGSKELRAEVFASQVNGGNVYFLRGDWNAPLRNELRGFPSGTYDDWVDGCSRAYSRLLLIRGKITISAKVRARI